MTKRPLWAPWRIGYVRQEKSGTACALCAAARDEESTLVVVRGSRCLVMLNRFPYASGHLMVLPTRHVGELTLLAQEEITEAMLLVQASVSTLRAVMEPDGFNVGLNLGQAAGAGIDQHFHLHVVPRWNGDTNFMPVLADTSVVPQALAATRDQLIARWAQAA